jgi:hypothetical protein
MKIRAGMPERQVCISVLGRGQAMQILALAAIYYSYFPSLWVLLSVFSMKRAKIQQRSESRFK